jgi:Tn3 transposase DDE domain
MDRLLLLINSQLWRLNLVTIAAVTWNTVSMAAVIDQLRAKGQTVNEDDLAPGSSLISRSFWGPSILDKSIRNCLPGYAVTSTTALIPLSRERTGPDPTNQIDVPRLRVSGWAIGRIQAT